MAEIHSFIYGIDADATVRKITVSRDGGATHMTLNPPLGSDVVPPSVRLSSKTAYHCRRPSGCLTSTKRSKSRLISMRLRLA